MNGEAIMTVSAAVAGLTQMVKWAGLPDRWGPIAVMVISALGVSIWGYSQGDFMRTALFGYFAGWVAVSMGAAGIFGFTRAAANAVISAKPPPNDGAGSSRTIAN